MGSDRNNPFQSWNGSTFPLRKGRLALSWPASQQLIPLAPQEHLGHPAAWPRVKMGPERPFLSPRMQGYIWGPCSKYCGLLLLVPL